MDVEPPLPDPLSPPPDTRYSTYRDRVYDRRSERHDRSHDRHRPGERERRPPPTDQRERGSKALSMVLRHRQIPQMRKDGFVPWEALLQAEELAGRWTSQDLVEVIEWSHNKEKQRRFEMALNLEDKGGIWVRATTRHTNGCNASQLPEGVTHETRSESDQKAMEAARRYGGPGSQRERRHGYPRHDARGPPRPVARPLDSTMPVPPGENRPRTPGRARSMSRPRTPGRPCTPESAPPEPIRQPILRKVSTQMAPPILQEDPVRQGSDQSTSASIISRHSDFPEAEGKQKGNKVVKLTEESETESSQDPDGLQPGEPIEAETIPKKGETSRGTSPSVAFNLEDDGSCEEMPAEEAFVSEWPAIILGVGKARKGFNGDAWSEQYPDDNNHYISFNENDMIAQVPHPQDETEQLKEESLRWAFGLKKGTTVQGWYPQHFVDMKF